MRETLYMKYNLLFLLFFSWCSAAPLQAGQQRYEITTTTVLPHLDEMRRQKNVLERCITDGALAELFPLLDEPAFRGCTITAQGDANKTLQLVCRSVNGAAGTGRVAADGNGWRGVLMVKMGGKNMTLEHHIRAVALGPCVVR